MVKFTSLKFENDAWWWVSLFNVNTHKGYLTAVSSGTCLPCYIRCQVLKSNRSYSPLFGIYILGHSRLGIVGRQNDYQFLFSCQTSVGYVTGMTQLISHLHSKTTSPKENHVTKAQCWLTLEPNRQKPNITSELGVKQCSLNETAITWCDRTRC